MLSVFNSLIGAQTYEEITGIGIGVLKLLESKRGSY